MYIRIKNKIVINNYPLNQLANTNSKHKLRNYIVSSFFKLSSILTELHIKGMILIRFIVIYQNREVVN